MVDSFDGQAHSFRYRLVDIRTIDAETLLESPIVEDNILAILCQLHNEREEARRILDRIASLQRIDRQEALTQLLVLSGLRDLATILKEVATPMPVYIDVMENEVLGPLIRDAIQKGVAKGIAEGIAREKEQLVEKLREAGEAAKKEALIEGLAKGLANGELTILKRQLQRRFGPLPQWALDRLNAASLEQLETYGERLLDAPTLEDALRD